MSNEAIKKYNAVMLESKQADLNSKLAALDGVTALANRNDVVTAEDVLEIIKGYKEVLIVQVSSYE